MVRLRVKEVAEARGFNMSSLMRASGLGFSTVKRIWKDPYHETSTVTLGRIAKALGVLTTDLIEDVPDEEENG